MRVQARSRGHGPLKEPSTGRGQAHSPGGGPSKEPSPARRPPKVRHALPSPEKPRIKKTKGPTQSSEDCASVDPVQDGVSFASVDRVCAGG